MNRDAEIKRIQKQSYDAAWRHLSRVVQDWVNGRIDTKEAGRKLVSLYSAECLITEMELKITGLFSNDKELAECADSINSALMPYYGLQIIDGEIRFNEASLTEHNEPQKGNRREMNIRSDYCNYSNNTDREVERRMEGFDFYHLDEEGKSVLRGYFHYLKQNSIKDIPYHFLVQADCERLAEAFAADLITAAEHIKNHSLPAHHFTEAALLDKPALSEYQNNDVMVVGPCLEYGKYYVGDYDTSNDKSCKEDYDYRWDRIMDYYDDHPDKVFILCTAKEIVEGRIKNNARMYERFFSHHIVIGTMDEDEIHKAVLNKISKSAANYTKQFELGIREYIDNVYPSSEIKNYDFADNLYYQVISLSFQKTGQCRTLDECSIPYYHKNESIETIDREFDKLVGLTEVKETFRDIGRLCQSLQNGADTPYLHLIFEGNPGTGKTTVAKFTARLFYALGITRSDHVEEVMTADLIGQYTGQTAPKVERALKRARGGVLVIEEAYLLNPESGYCTDTFREECIGTLIKAMEKKSDPVIIFAGYPKQMEELIKSNPGFSSRIGYIMNFEDYDNNQLLTIFKSMCERDNYDYDDETIEAVRKKITALRYEEHFGNARSVETIFNQAVTEYLREEQHNRVIKARHVVIKKTSKSTEELQEELDALVGISDAKKVLREQVLSNRFSQEKTKPLPTSNNMVFVGNAGTGKTTSAKLFAEILFSIGAAKSPRTKMITAKDLYVSDVAGKLNEICNEIMGGVLFIDEIYLLNKSQFICTEVVSVLLDLLENRKEDLTVILAGYEDQMDTFLSDNQGLKSRFPITVHFDDFTEDELCQIFQKNCEEGNLIVSTEAMERFREIISKEMRKANFGNGRTVRNIYEQAFRRHAVNYYKNASIDSEVLTAEDLEVPAAINTNAVQIGFI